MPYLCISEYHRLGIDYAGQTVMSPYEPSNAEQAVPITAESAVSAPFGPNTRFIYYFVDVASHVAFANPGETPVAQAPLKKMGAYDGRYATVQPGGTMAVIAGSP